MLLQNLGGETKSIMVFSEVVYKVYCVYKLLPLFLDPRDV